MALAPTHRLGRALLLLACCRAAVPPALSAALHGGSAATAPRLRVPLRRTRVSAELAEQLRAARAPERHRAALRQAPALHLEREEHQRALLRREQNLSLAHRRGVRGIELDAHADGALRARTPRQRRGRKADIGVSARSEASIGRIGPCADRL